MSEVWGVWPKATGPSTMSTASTNGGSGAAQAAAGAVGGRGDITKPAGQRPRFQAGRDLPPRAHRQPARAVRPGPLEFRMDAAFCQRDAFLLLPPATRGELTRRPRLQCLLRPPGTRVMLCGCYGPRQAAGDAISKGGLGPALPGVLPFPSIENARRDLKQRLLG